MEAWREWSETQELGEIIRRIAKLPGGRKLMGIAVKLTKPLLDYKANRRKG